MPSTRWRRRGLAAAHSPKAPSTCSHAPAAAQRRRSRQRVKRAGVDVAGLGADDRRPVGSAAARRASASARMRPWSSAGTSSSAAVPRPEQAERPVDRDVPLLAGEDPDRRRARRGRRARRPSRPRASTWCRAAASAVMLAPWAPVTNPLETPFGQPEQLGEPARGNLLDAPRRGGWRRRDRRSDPRPSRASPPRGRRAARSPMTKPKYRPAAMPTSPARQPRRAPRPRLRPSAPASGSGPPRASASSSIVARAWTGRSSERAEEPGGMVGCEPKDVLLRRPQRAKVHAGSPGRQRARKRWIGGCSAIPSSSSGAKSRWPRTASSCEATASSEPSRSPAKMMWTTCFDDEVGRARSSRRSRPAPRPDGALDARPPPRARAGARRAGSRRSGRRRRGAASPPGPASRGGRAGCAPRQRRMRRDADPRLGAHAYARDDPKPRTPRSLAGSSSTSTSSSSGTGRTTSWAIRMPGSTVNDSLAVGVEQDDPHLAAVAGVDQARARSRS